jgi:hypothetical protein
VYITLSIRPQPPPSSVSVQPFRAISLRKVGVDEPFAGKRVDSQGPFAVLADHDRGSGSSGISGEPGQVMPTF